MQIQNTEKKKPFYGVCTMELKENKQTQLQILAEKRTFGIILSLFLGKNTRS